ncbi:MAG: SDR family oxidoreductase [Venatoribacter sp.]
MSRIYVITGAGGGIGLATANLLKQQGHKVVGVDLKNADVQADLSTVSGRKKAVAEVLAVTSKIDAIIASAGIAAPIAKTISVNYFGVTEFIEGLLSTLAKSEHPRIAVVSSAASLMPNSPELVEALLENDEEKSLGIGKKLEEQGAGLGYLNDPSSKRAISRWVRQVAVTERYAGQHIPINAVGPGVVVTDMTHDLIATEEARKAVDASMPMPLNYHAQAEDVANLLIWLTSVENNHVTGQTVYIDGGADVVMRGDDIW